ncbi:hypothetical protein [Micromonospora sp. 067-2]|uniref:hypothetical protein n=1 Tax=Micromonospora sp. 067-2 TaxID=2789270 RepID=UPI00397D5577
MVSIVVGTDGSRQALEGSRTLLALAAQRIGKYDLLLVSDRHVAEVAVGGVDDLGQDRGCPAAAAQPPASSAAGDSSGSSIADTPADVRAERWLRGGASSTGGRRGHLTKTYKV